MKKPNLITLALAFAIVAITLAVSHAADQGQFIPFKVSGSGSSTPIGQVPPSEDCPAGGVVFMAQDEGVGAPLGQFQTTYHSIAVCPDSDEMHYVGTATITAANGDTVEVTFALSGTSQAFPLPFSGTLVITGGTGRFAGADGELTTEGFFNPLELTFTYETEGFISRPVAPGNDD
jgi:hypothetical protein